MTRKEQVAEAVKIASMEYSNQDSPYGEKEVGEAVLVLLSLATDYLAGKIGEYATEEEIANTILFCLESGQWHLVSTLVNSGDVVDIAHALFNKIPRRGVEG